MVFIKETGNKTPGRMQTNGDPYPLPSRNVKWPSRCGNQQEGASNPDSAALKGRSSAPSRCLPVGQLQKHFREPCSSVFAAVPSTTAKLQNQPRCPQWRDGYRNWLYIHTQWQFFIGKKEIMLFVENWMQLGIITLSESSQSLRGNYCMFPLICVSWTLQVHKVMYVPMAWK